MRHGIQTHSDGKWSLRSTMWFITSLAPYTRFQIWRLQIGMVCFKCIESLSFYRVFENIHKFQKYRYFCEEKKNLKMLPKNIPATMVSLLYNSIPNFFYYTFPLEKLDFMIIYDRKMVNFSIGILISEKNLTW